MCGPRWGHHSSEGRHGRADQHREAATTALPRLRRQHPKVERETGLEPATACLEGSTHVQTDSEPQREKRWVANPLTQFIFRTNSGKSPASGIRKRSQTSSRPGDPPGKVTRAGRVSYFSAPLTCIATR